MNIFVYIFFIAVIFFSIVSDLIDIVKEKQSEEDEGFKIPNTFAYKLLLIITLILIRIIHYSII